MDQIKFVEDSLSRPCHFKFLKVCLPHIPQVPNTVNSRKKDCRKRKMDSSLANPSRQSISSRSMIFALPQFHDNACKEKASRFKSKN